jgi:hypothetical protein
MKSNVKIRKVKAVGVKKQSKMGVERNANMFIVLSDKLYTNKIKAVIRELGCNALDSHNEAGYPEKPFKVHLPTPLEPFFSVKDEGIGLDHDGVTKVFSTFFHSTKSDNNKFIGAFGLGSKSPFAYVDSYTITAVKAGKKRVYAAHKIEDGSPTVSLLSASNTEEPNGVEINFHVNEDDFYRFSEEAIEVFKWFKVIPDIANKEDIEQERNEITNYYNHNIAGHLINDAHIGTYTVVMGNVAYPLPDDFKKQLPNPSKAVSDFVDNCCFVLNCNIGEVGIAPSREALSLDKTTLKALQDKLEEVVKQIDKLYNKKVEYKSKYYATAAFQELLSVNRYFHSIERKGIFYRNEGKEKFVYQSWDKQHGITIKRKFFEHIRCLKKSGSLGKLSAHNVTARDTAPYFEYDAKAKFVLNDTDNKHAVRAFLELSEKEFADATDVYLLCPKEHRAYVKLFKRLLGHPDLVCLSTMINTHNWVYTPPVRTATISSFEPFWELDKYNTVLRDVPDGFDPASVKWWLKSKANMVEFMGAEYTPNAAVKLFCNKLDIMNEILALYNRPQVTAIYGCKFRGLKRLEGLNPVWMEDGLKSLISEVIVDKRFLDCLTLHESHNVSNTVRKIADLCNMHLLSGSQYLTDTLRLSETTFNYYAVEWVKDWANKFGLTIVKDSSILFELDNFKAKYPLLQFIETYQVRGNYEFQRAVQDYINRI